MEEAARLCDRVAIMDLGRIIALGRPAGLVDSLGAGEIIEFRVAGEIGPDLLAGLPGVKGVSRKNGDVSLSVVRVAETLPALMAELDGLGTRLARLATHQASLEDVFLRLTGRSLRDG
jgi:ABC-2 type transport system ATP-binding protein